MENKEIKLIVPDYFTGNVEIEWLKTNDSKVEVGDPIAIADKDGERYFVVSPVSGMLRILSKAPLFAAGLGLALAYVSILAVESEGRIQERNKVGKKNKSNEEIPEEVEVYMTKLREVVKDAVKDDFLAVNQRFNDIDSRLSSLEGRTTSIDAKVNGIQDIKNYLKIK